MFVVRSLGMRSSAELPESLPVKGWEDRVPLGSSLNLGQENTVRFRKGKGVDFRAAHHGDRLGAQGGRELPTLGDRFGPGPSHMHSIHRKMRIAGHDDRLPPRQRL